MPTILSNVPGNRKHGARGQGREAHAGPELGSAAFLRPGCSGRWSPVQWELGMKSMFAVGEAWEAKPDM